MVIKIYKKIHVKLKLCTEIEEEKNGSTIISRNQSKQEVKSSPKDNRQRKRRWQVGMKKQNQKQKTQHQTQEKSTQTKTL